MSSNDNPTNTVVTSTTTPKISPPPHGKPPTTIKKNSHAEYVSRLLKYPLPSKYVSSDMVKPTLVYFSITSLLLTGELDTYLTDTDQHNLLRALVYQGQRENHIANQYALLATYVQLGYYTHSSSSSTNKKNNRHNTDTVETNVIMESDLHIPYIPSIPDTWRQHLYELIPRLYQPSGNIACYPTKPITVCSGGSREYQRYPSTEIEADVRFIYSMLMCYIFANLSHYIPCYTKDNNDDVRNHQKNKDDENKDALSSSLQLPLSTIRKYLVSCQTYEGGFSLHPGNESHGGSTYCTVMSLILLEYLEKYPTVNLLSFLLLHPFSSSSLSSFSRIDLTPSINVSTLERWLYLRLPMLEYEYTLIEDSDPSVLLPRFRMELPSTLPLIGITGRTNKVADSCYSFWILATHQVLEKYTTMMMCCTTDETTNINKSTVTMDETGTAAVASMDTNDDGTTFFVTLVKNFLDSCTMNHHHQSTVSPISSREKDSPGGSGGGGDNNSTETKKKVDEEKYNATTTTTTVDTTIPPKYKPEGGGGGYSRESYSTPDIFHTHYSLWGIQLLSNSPSVYPLFGIKFG